MPSVTCPFCSSMNCLPDPWPHSGFNCYSCGQPVSFGRPLPPPLPPPPPADPFDTSDAPSRPHRVEHRNRTTMGDSAAQGFGQAFGAQLGNCAGCIVVGVFGLICVSAFIVYLNSKAPAPIPNEQITPNEPPAKPKIIKVT